MHKGAVFLFQYCGKAEWVWQQMDDMVANTAPRDRHDMRLKVTAAITRVKRSPRRMWAGFAGAKLTIGTAWGANVICSVLSRSSESVRQRR